MKLIFAKKRFKKAKYNSIKTSDINFIVKYQTILLKNLVLYEYLNSAILNFLDLFVFSERQTCPYGPIRCEIIPKK